MAREDTQFKKGQSGNPKGRKKGSKNRLTKAYLKDLYGIYLEVGKEGLQRLCEERPEVFFKLVDGKVPKDLDIKQSGDVQINIVRFKGMYKKEE